MLARTGAGAELDGGIAGRPRLLHADRSTRPIWYQRHVVLTVDRLREAAVDVLFNKATWQSLDDERRQARVPRHGTLDQSAGFFLTRGLDLRSALRVFDPFGSFPMYLGGGLELAVPFGLWAVPDGRSLTLLSPATSPGLTLIILCSSP